MRGQLAQLQAAMARSGGLGGAAATERSVNRMTGSLRSAGYALTTTFTAPLLLAGHSLLKFQLANETAMADLKKVYGSNPLKDYSKDVKALGRNFTALSEKFGVNKTEVIGIGAAWAQAGVQGAALAQSVDNTLRAMVIGDLNSKDATTALISIQGQYRASASDLTKILADLNVVENTTAISMEGLITGFQRAAGAAANGGVSYRELAALLASITPYAGTAAQAGNSLKTIFSNLEAPSANAAEALHLVGIRLNDPGWKSASATDKLREVAKSFEHLSDAQKNVIARQLSGAFQVSRFDVLLHDVGLSLDKTTASHSRFGQALAATANAQNNARIATRELNIVLDSNPKKLQIMSNIMKNELANILVKLMPLILNIVNAITRLVTWFSNLSPEVQKLVGYLVVFLAVLGPILLYLSALRDLVKFTGGAFKFLLTPLGLLPRLFQLLLAPGKAVLTMLGWMAGGFGLAGRGAEKGTVEVGASMQTMLAEVAAIMREMLSVMAAIWAQIDEMQIVSGARQVRTARATATAVTETTAAGAAATATATEEGMAAAAAATETVAGTMITIWLTVWRDLFNITTVGVARTVGEIETGLVAIEGSLSSAVVVYDAEWAAFWQFFTAQAAVGMAETVTVTRVGFAEIEASAVTAGVATEVGFLGRLRRLPGAVLGFFAAIPGRILGIFTAIPRLIGGVFSRIIPILAGVGRAIFAVLTGPIGIAIAAVILAFALFGKQIRQAWNNIVNWFRDGANGIVKFFQPLINIFNAVVKQIIHAWNLLPEGIRNALIAVVNIVESAVKAVYNLFSYLNPWAHHSPSLVENVVSGLAAVRDEFATLTDVSDPINRAYNDIKRFGSAVATMTGRANRITVATDISSIRKAGGGAAQISAYRQDTADIAQLTQRQTSLSAAMKTQQSVVDSLDAALKRQNATIATQTLLLNQLQAVQQAAQDRMSQAQADLQKYQSMGITGQKAMADAIFATQMQEKALQLQMMKIEDVTGPMSDVQARMQALQGSMDTLRGTASSLRAAGAGTDITGVYDAQVSAMEKQYQGTQTQITQYDSLQKQLAETQRKTQELQLQDSLTYDPLVKQINDAASAMKEMPFDQILAGTKKARTELTLYTDQYDAATAAVKSQENVIKSLSVTRDSLQSKYDAENAKLDILKKSYQDVGQAISDVNSQLAELTQSAGTVNQAAAAAAAAAKSKTGHPAHLTNLDKNFAAAAGGNFPTALLKGGLNAGKAGDIKGIDALTNSAFKDVQKSLGNLNPFKGISKHWHEFVGWWKTNVVPNMKAMWDNLFGGGGKGSGAVAKAFSGIGSAVRTLLGWLHPLWTAITQLWKLFAPDVIQFWNDLKSAFFQIGADILPQVVPLFKALWDLLVAIWPAVKLIAEIIGGAFLLAFKVLASVFVNVLHPALSFFISIIGDMMRVLRGIIQFITSLFTGDWKKAWDGILNIFMGVFKGIFDFLHAIFGSIWNTVKGFVVGIVDFFMWLYQAIGSPASSVFHAIGTAISAMGSVAKTVFHAIGAVFSAIWSVVKVIIGAFATAWHALWTGIKAVWNTVAPVFAVIAKILYAAIGLPFVLIITAAKLAWTVAWGVIKAVWNTVGKPVFDGLHTIVSFVWNSVLKPIFGFIKSAWSLLWGAVKGVYTGVIKPIFDAVGTAFSYVWNKILKPLFTAAKTDWNLLWSGVKAVYHNIIKPIFDAVGNAISVVYHTVLKPIFDTIRTAWDKLWNGISNAFGAIWHGIKHALAVGINAVISVINWFIDKIDWVLGKLPGKFSIDPIKKVSENATGGVIPGGARKYAVGGVLPGYAPGIDSIPIPVHMFSGGEGILVPEAVRALGGAKFINEINAHFSNRISSPGHFQGGGPVPVGPGIGGGLPGAGNPNQPSATDPKTGQRYVHHDPGSFFGGIWDAIKGGLREIALAALNGAEAPLRAVADHIPSEILRHFVQGGIGWVDREIRDLIGANADKNHKLLAAGGGFHGAAVGGAGQLAIWKNLRSVGMTPAQAAGVMGNMQSESGFNPYIIQGGGTSLNPAAAGSGGYGLVQWTPGSKLIPYLHGKQPSISTEIAALAEQLSGRGPSAEGAAGARLRRATTPQGAALAFGLGYERYAGGVQGSRSGQADAIYARFKSYDRGGILPPGISKVFNNTGMPEIVIPQRTFEQLMKVMLPKLAQSNASVNRANAPSVNSGNENHGHHKPAVTYHSEDKSTIIKIEKVEFPNIRSSVDAKSLLDSLESLANGSR